MLLHRQHWSEPQKNRSEGYDAIKVDQALSILRGQEFHWPTNKDFAASFLRFCRQEGLTGLVFKALKDTRILSEAPKDIRAGLAESQIAGKWIRLLVDEELARVFHRLSVLGIQALLFKGGALAHLLYPEPWLRLGCDSDIFIRSADRERMENSLIELGYKRHQSVGGDLLIKQASYSRNRDGYTVVLDIQWGFSQAQVLSGLLEFDDLYKESREIPAIGPQARTFSKVDSLILACAHWIGHLTGRKLIWLFDIHLLVESMTEAEQIDFCRSAERKRVCGICLHTLNHAAEYFGTKIPARISTALEKIDSPGQEPSTQLLRQKSQAGRIWGDLISVSGWWNKLQLAAEHLFPSADYMRHRYGYSNRLVLPFLYVHRAWKGVWKLTR
jgi:hypothetical protein